MSSEQTGSFVYAVGDVVITILLSYTDKKTEALLISLFSRGPGKVDAKKGIVASDSMPKENTKQKIQ